MAVVPFKRPESRDAPPVRIRRSFAEFAGAMALIGVVFFLLPSLWSGFSVHLLAVVHLLIAVVYFQQGPRIAAAVWIALTLGVLVLFSAPSPVTYLLGQGASAFDAALVR